MTLLNGPCPVVALPASSKSADAAIWRDLMVLRRSQAKSVAHQPTLFALREDHRAAGVHTARERYREPSLFAVHDGSG